MAVLKSKRGISNLEFENNFVELYRFSSMHISKVPKRKKKWLCEDINKDMNLLYKKVMDINELYFRSKSARSLYISESILSIEYILKDLNKHLLSLWNIQGYDFNTMEKWAMLIKKEIFLLNKEGCDNFIDLNINILDWDYINKAIFLKNMSELHRYTHSKVINAKNDFDDTDGNLLISLVNDAFYELILANTKVPKTKEEYEVRRNHISKAITYLGEMNRPMLFYFNMMEYSERIMVEWSELLVNELKMLISLQSSDKERFKNLP